MLAIHWRILAVSVFVALLSLFTAAIAYVLAAPLGPGDHSLFVRYDGRECGAVVHVPPPARRKTGLPALLSQELFTPCFPRS